MIKGRSTFRELQSGQVQTRILEPDLFYVSAETESRLQPNHRTTADLVVEVISPGSAIYDRKYKVRHLRCTRSEGVAG